MGRAIIDRRSAGTFVKIDLSSTIGKIFRFGTSCLMLKHEHEAVMPQFVILHHHTPPGAARGPHFDLMLEHHGVLLTWALAALPAAGETVLAEKLANHRIDYLILEGEIAGGRGTVRRFDEGAYQIVSQRADELVVRLAGRHLTGTLRLALDDGGDQRWRVSFAE